MQSYCHAIEDHANLDPTSTRMKQDLTSLLQAIPFAPFIVKTRDGKVYVVDAVGQMCVGKVICAYVDAEGHVLAIPFDAIDRVILADPKHPPQARSHSL
jgi:hypothetical protein